MRYRNRNIRAIDDKTLTNDFGKGAAGLLGGNPFAFGDMILGFYDFVVTAIAFISRSFLRVRLGERTFSFFTILVVYMLVVFILLFPEAYKAAGEYLTMFDDRSFIVSKIIILLFTFLYIPLMAFTDQAEFKNLLPEITADVFILLIIISVIGLGHIFEVLIRRKRKDVLHSFYRGDSLLFSWLENKKFLGRIIKKNDIWMVVEPIFVLLIAFLIDHYMGYENTALILAISGLALFLEEYKIYLENRRFTLDMIDGHLDADYLNEMQDEYIDKIKKLQVKSPKEFEATFGLTGGLEKQNNGSDSIYRARIC